VGRAFDDRRLLGVARTLESVFARSPETSRPRPDLGRLAASTVDLQDLDGLWD
jgi:hypothetical protein